MNVGPRQRFRKRRNVLLSKARRDYAEVDAVNTLTAKIGRVVLGVLGQLSVLGAQHEATGASLGVYDDAEALSPGDRQGVCLTTVALSKPAQLEAQRAKRIGTFLLEKRVRVLTALEFRRQTVRRQFTEVD